MPVFSGAGIGRQEGTEYKHRRRFVQLCRVRLEIFIHYPDGLTNGHVFPGKTDCAGRAGPRFVKCRGPREAIDQAEATTRIAKFYGVKIACSVYHPDGLGALPQQVGAGSLGKPRRGVQQYPPEAYCPQYPCHPGAHSGPATQLPQTEQTGAQHGKEQAQGSQGGNRGGLSRL